LSGNLAVLRIGVGYPNEDEGLEDWVVSVTPTLESAGKIRLEVEARGSPMFWGHPATDEDQRLAEKARYSPVHWKAEGTVRNGEAIYFGDDLVGVLKEHKRVPILGRLPFLGRQFSYVKTSKSKFAVLLVVRAYEVDAAGMPIGFAPRVRATDASGGELGAQNQEGEQPDAANSDSAEAPSE